MIRVQIHTLKTWEWVVVGAAVVSILFSTYWLTGNRFLYPWVLGIKSSESTLTVMGKLKWHEGVIKRQSVGVPVFNSIEINTKLNSEDIVITESESKATLELNDGSVIELGPSSMVKLSMESQVGLSGISRSASIEVISGAVKVAPKKDKLILKSLRSKPVVLAENQVQKVEVENKPIVLPKVQVVELAKTEKLASQKSGGEEKDRLTNTPSESVSEPAIAPLLSVVQPFSGESFSLNGASKIPEVEVPLKLKSNPEKVPFELELKREDTTIKTYSDSTQLGEWVSLLKLDEPGRYQLSLRHSNNEPLRVGSNAVAEFVVPSEAEIIKKPSVIIKSDLKNFAVAVKWQPTPLSKEYWVSYSDPQTGKLKRTSPTQSSTVLVLEGVPFNGLSRIRVEAKGKNGFVLVSPWTEVKNQVSPVELTAPEANALLDYRKTIVFAWSRMPGASQYVLEISSDPLLGNVLIQKKVIKNFYTHKFTSSGVFYWRVKAVTATNKNLASSVIRKLEILK